MYKFHDKVNTSVRSECPTSPPPHPQIFSSVENVRFEVQHINPLKKIQKKCVRAITFSEYLAPSQPIFQTLNVLNFENLVIQRILLIMFKYSHGDVPVSVSQLFRTNNEYHDYNTRNCARIHAPVGTTEASYRTFGYRGIHIWNHISQKIYTNTSYPGFEKNVKIYIQNNNLDNLRLNY